MEVSNRVLTVSYGTFSCSLEGFDDPLSVLQKVTEYFQKLSSEDRYFGSEPQVPDTSKIHRIAEAANPNKIEAKVHDNGVVLRQKSGADPADLDLTPAAVVSAAEVEPANSNKGDGSGKKKKKKRRHKNRNKGQPVTPGVFRSRRHDALEDSAPEQTDDASQVSVEETLAKIKQTVESAEDEIDRDAADNAVSTLRLTTESLDPAPQDEAIASTEPSETDDVAADESEPVTGDEITADAGPGTQEIAPVDEVVAVQANSEIVEDGSGEANSMPSPQEDEQPEEDPDLQEVAAANTPHLGPHELRQQQKQQSSLSADDEAELAEALESVQADDAEVESRRENRRKRSEALRSTSDLDREDEALDRLLETTNSQMDGPERQRRSNALDQLKAAVVATEAEKTLSGTDISGDLAEESRDDDELAAYREDLQRAQRKSRRMARKAAQNTGSAPVAAPTPLILVSEQRIDEPENEEQPKIAAELHEVTETEGNLALKPEPHTHDESPENGIPASAFRESSSFREFADQIGAVNLQDMLEAAAAYTSIVEGRPRFSRAQVMSKLAKVSTADAFSKEAGLRSFGKLLREGKILRVQDGQFAISKSSRFSIASRYDN